MRNFEKKTSSGDDESILDYNFDSSKGEIDHHTSDYAKNRMKNEELRSMIIDLVAEFDKYSQIEGNNPLQVLKKILTSIIKSKLLIDINKETESIRESIKALRFIQKLQTDIMKFGNLTKFAFIPICSVMYERILFHISMLSEKYDQKKTQFFIFKGCTINPLPSLIA